MNRESQSEGVKGLVAAICRMGNGSKTTMTRLQQAKMKSWILTVLFLVSGALETAAQTNSAPARLAIVVEDSSAAAAGDVLTAELSKTKGLHLLERNEIQRVYREQALSAGNKDYLKLGQILGADGLLLLEGIQEGTNQWINVQLVAVKPGVLLSSERFARDAAPATEWAAGVSKHLSPLLPKLAVLAKDAHPISVVNLRSAIQSTESRELERQLTLLAIERLSREKDLFVLERRRMQLMTSEKELGGLNDSAFWDGSYLLDGVIDREGFNQNTMKISARLRPASGGMPVPIEVSCSRTNYADAVNQLTDKILKALKLNGNREPWNAADEADQFYAEAQWAFRWGLYPQAQAATEAAWALGKQTADLAFLRICAYLENPPVTQQFQRQLNAYAVPDDSQIPKCSRALEMLVENQDVLLKTNALPQNKGYMLGVQLLRQTASLLESYYYAAELRVGHEEQLTELRERTREALKAMDAHPPFLDPSRRWDYLPSHYGWLKWDEGGLAFNHPEEALPMLRGVLESNFQPERLPRLIGWTWEDRKRVPRLMRQFIAELRASANPILQVEGAFLALLWTPVDGGNALAERERELLAAIWENRGCIFTNAQNASLLEEIEKTLRDKYEFNDINRPKPFDHEPFASFKHRVRMDYLEHATQNDREVLSTLFPFEYYRPETPEQARDLVPLFLNYQQKFNTNKWIGVDIERVRQRAGLPPQNTAPAKPTWPAEDVLEAKFIRWQLKRPGIDPDRKPSFRQLMARNGRLWAQVRYRNQHTEVSPNDVQITFINVDPATGATDEIPLPEKFGTSFLPFAYDLNNDFIFVNANDHLYQCSIRDKKWTLAVPMEISGQPVCIKDKVFISRGDSLMEVNLDLKSLRLLVSSRRQPPENKIDPIWGGDAYRRVDDRLGFLSDIYCLDFDLQSNWNVRPFPLGTNSMYPKARFVSDSGAAWLTIGPLRHRFVVGCWNEDSAAESLLMEEKNEFPGGYSPKIEERLLPTRWDWPNGFVLETAEIIPAEKALWVLCTRKEINWFKPGAPEPVNFSDNRDATIFYFGAESRAPISYAIRLQNNGQTTDPFNPREGRFQDVFQRVMMHMPGDGLFWLKTEQGLVIGAPAYCGHWLIPASVLKTKIEARQQSLRVQATTPSLK